MYCKEDYKVEDYKKFIDLTMPVRISFTCRNRLCDKCFERGHFDNFCGASNSCFVKSCSLNDHTLLHHDAASKNSSKSYLTKIK